MDFTEEEARRQGYRFIELYTNEVMVENIARYRHLGYVETNRVRVAGYDRVYLRKALYRVTRTRRPRSAPDSRHRPRRAPARRRPRGSHRTRCSRSPSSEERLLGTKCVMTGRSRGWRSY